MRSWLSVISEGLLLLLVVFLAAHRPAVSAAKIKTVQCTHTFERNLLRFAPFFYKKPLLAASLPCRYKLANFKCGDTKAELLADVDRHAFYTSKLPHFLRGVIVSLTVGAQRAEYSLSNDTLHQYFIAGDLTLDPWQKDSQVDVKSYYDVKNRTAVIERSGLRIGYTWHREFDSAWEWGYYSASGGVVLNIVCNDTFSTYEGFPNTTCGHTGFDSTLLVPGSAKEWADFPLDVHHIAEHDQYYGNFAMLAYHNVKQTNPVCEDAAAVAKSPCPGNSKYRKRGDIFYNCQQIYNHHLLCGQTNAIDPLKVYVACLRIQCAAEGEATPADVCRALYEVSRKCGNLGYHTSTSDLLALSTCPPDPSIPTTTTPLSPAPTTPTTTTPRPYYYTDPVCRLSDRSSVFQQYYQKRIVNPPLYFLFSTSQWSLSNGVVIDVPCRFKLADIRCSGATIAMEIDYRSDVEGLTYPDAVFTEISTTSADGLISKRTLEINHRYLEMLTGVADRSDAPFWVADLVANGGVSTMTSDGLTLTYNATRRCLMLARDKFTFSFCYINAADVSRSGGYVITLGCTDYDFRGKAAPESLCGSGEHFSSDSLIGLVQLDAHHRRILRPDLLILATQDVQQTREVCSKAKAALNLGSAGCKEHGENLFECLNVNDLHGDCMRTNKIDPLQVLATCLQVLCEPGEWQEPQTCSVLQEAAGVCGGPAGAINGHLNIDGLLAKAGCHQEAY